MPKIKRKPTAIGCHVFAGGFTLGVSKYFNVIAHFETSKFGVATAKHNFSKLQIYQSEEAWPVDDLYGKIDLVFSNPPCAPWSAAGRSKRDFTTGSDPNDSRTQCFKQSWSLLHTLRPRVLMIESVTQTWIKGKPFVFPLLQEAIEEGYAVSIVYHNAVDCGTPQNRKRIMFVAHDFSIDWKKPTIACNTTVKEAWDAAGLTSHESLETVPKMKGEESSLISKTKQGGKLRETYNKLYGDTRLNENKNGQRAGCPGFLVRRLAANEISPTHTGDPVMFHPTLDRKLTILETQILCGFPKSYEFIGTGLYDRFNQIAKGVTPPVGVWFAKTIYNSLMINKPTKPIITEYDFIKG